MTYSNPTNKKTSKNVGSITHCINSNIWVKIKYCKANMKAVFFSVFTYRKMVSTVVESKFGQSMNLF